MSVSASAYRHLTGLVGWFLPHILRGRIRKGKEDPERAHERFAEDLAMRPDGPLVWIHAASVGEGLLGLNVAEALSERRPDLNFLFTTQTLTSAGLIADRIASGPLKTRALHQMAPVDTPKIATRFIQHWRPDLAVFVEGEIWPNLIGEAKRAGSRLSLINGRMTEKSLANWSRHHEFAERLFGGFDAILAADSRTGIGLKPFTDIDILEPGNLKSALPPPGVDEALLSALQADLGDRKVWLAASTHPGEEAFVLEASAGLKVDPLLILAPRHPERGDEVEALIKDAGFSLARRSKGEAPSAETQVYLADTMGEMGLWIRLASGVYLGGGTARDIGGHNPLEMVKLGKPVASGRLVFNFDTLFSELETLGPVSFVDTPADLATEVSAWLSGVDWPDLTAWEAKLAAPMNITLDALEPLLPEEEPHS